MAERLYRYFTCDRAKIDANQRTIPVAFSSEYPVMRWDSENGQYWEVLDHSPESVDLSRLKAGAPLLDMHDMRRQIGVVEDPAVGADKKGRALIRFSRAPAASDIFRDFQDGIRKNISVGYELTRIISSSVGDDGLKVIRFAWAPFEVSAVPVPADPEVGVGRSDVDNPPLQKKTNMRNLLLDPNAQPGGGGAAIALEPDPVEKERKRVRKINEAAEAAVRNFPQNADAIRSKAQQAIGSGTKAKAFRADLEASTVGVQLARPQSVVEMQNEVRDKERARTKNINEAADSLAKNFPEGAEKFRAMAKEAIDNGQKSRDFNAALLAAIPGIRASKPITMASMGMNQREQQTYSMVRGIQSVIKNNGRLDGLEGEVHAEMCKRNIGISPQGFWVPHDALISADQRSLGRRDLNVNTFGQGGAFVPTILQVPIIELLRNRMVCSRLGVQPLAGLAGNVAIPRQTGAATAYALPESATLTKSTQAIDQILLTPHRVGAWNDYTKQLLLQSSVDVENFIRNDLMTVLAIKWDYLILQGAGANSEPTGILNTAGIGSVTFGGAATWAQIISFETALAVANADAGNMAYVSTPTVRGKFKGVPKVGSTFPVFIWETANWGDGSNDGMVNGYRAAATNQILGNALVFGNWADAIGPAMWGGYDVVVNPYTRDTDGVVRITVNTFGDVAVRHSASFCWSADSAAQ